MSCLGLDGGFTVKAQIGGFENPFMVKELAGVNATIGSSARPVSTSAMTMETESRSSFNSSRLGSGAVAGAIVCSLTGFFLLPIGVYLFLRHSKLSKQRRELEQEAENEEDEKSRRRG